jgi:hypothetical protein
MPDERAQHDRAEEEGVVGHGDKHELESQR